MPRSDQIQFQKTMRNARVGKEQRISDIVGKEYWKSRGMVISGWEIKKAFLSKGFY